MDLKQLRYFAAVAEEGSITAAARRLYLSQPPLSMQLQALEREVGCRLFERGRRHITLTDAGRVLYGYACSMLETQQSALDEIAALREGSGGVLRLGMVSSLSGTLAADWLAEFCGERKGVRLEIYEANTYELIQRLRRRSVHLALVRQPFQTEDLLSHPLAGEAMVAVARRELLPREDASWAAPHPAADRLSPLGGAGAPEAGRGGRRGGFPLLLRRPHRRLPGGAGAGRGGGSRFRSRAHARRGHGLPRHSGGAAFPNRGDAPEKHAAAPARSGISGFPFAEISRESTKFLIKAPYNRDKCPHTGRPSSGSLRESLPAVGTPTSRTAAGPGGFPPPRR